MARRTVHLRLAATVAAILCISVAVAQVMNNAGTLLCPRGFMEVNGYSPEVTNVTETAFLEWLDIGSPATPNISCNGNITNTYALYPYIACQQSSTYEVVFEADFNCFYNQTDVNLPDISDQNAVLNDTVFLDAQIKTSSSNPGADSQVVFANLLYAYEDYPYYDY